VRKHSKFAGRVGRFAVASGIVVAALAPSAALAAPYPDGGGTEVENSSGTQVEGVSASRSSTLPFTGGDVAGLALIGAGAAVAGVVMVRHSRRHRATA